MPGIEGFVSRKRGGCSPSSSSSSVFNRHNYRFKRAILVGKVARGSRSSTPVPSWRTAAANSPKYTQSISGKTSRPVSARKLAATLWEMNGVPSPGNVNNVEEKRRLKREMKGRERMVRLPPHLSDPSHSPVSERTERSSTSSHHKRTPTISYRLRPANKSSGIADSRSSVSLMEIESKSRGQIPGGHGVSVQTRLKDVSNALTTSKELLKIVSRISARDEQASSNLSLISALHTELDRARLQVNQLMHEHRSEQTEMSHLLKSFAEEKASWNSKQQRVVESAIESVASELEIERKFRRRLESLNKRLGNELSDTKESLMKAVKELEREKKARDIMQQVCDDLAADIGEDKIEVRVSDKIHKEVGKEREVLHFADMLREERVQMKSLEAKYQHEEKNVAVDKVKDQLEALMKAKRSKDKGHCYLSRTNFSLHQSQDDGEVENDIVSEEDSGESDLHSIELDMDNTKRSYKWDTFLGQSRDNSRFSVDNAIKACNSNSGRPPRKSINILKGTSDGVDWDEQSESIRKLDENLDKRRLQELEKRSLMKSLLGRISSSSRASPVKGFSSPTGRRDPACDDSVSERPTTGHRSNMTSRLVDEIRRSRH